MRACCAVLAIPFLAISCAYYGSAHVDSSPQGAQVYDFGSSTLLGVTPFQHTWRSIASDEIWQTKEAQHVTVRVVKAGYKPKMEAFSVPLNFLSYADAANSPRRVLLVLEKE